jgi:hypothetical protein
LSAVQSEKKEEVAFGIDDPEFKELLGDVLKDDEQAKEAMKGIAQMMQMMGQCFGNETSE